MTAEIEGHEVAEAHASFETFFEQTNQRLFGGLCLVTGNRHEAEEITVIAPEASFEEVIDDAAPILDSIEFHAP